MKISKTGKIIIGILTIAQLFIGLFVVILVLTMIFPLAINSGDPGIEEALLFSAGKFIFLGIVLSVLSLGLLIFYIIHAGTNQHISTAMKVVWIVLLFFLGAVVQVVYYFMEIVPEHSLTAKLEHTDQSNIPTKDYRI